MTEIKPVIALAVLDEGRVNVKIQADLTQPAAVALTKCLVQQLAGMYGILPSEFLRMVKGSLQQPATVENAKPRLIYNG